MNKLITHIKVWNQWRKGSANPCGYKLLVLLGLVVSPTFEVCKCMYKFRQGLYKLSDAVNDAAAKLSEFSALVKENENG